MHSDRRRCRASDPHRNRHCKNGWKRIYKKISDGAKVHAGDVLIEADLNAIKEAGHPATTMMILTNTDLYDSVECAAPGTVTGKSSVMKLTK